MNVDWNFLCRWTVLEDWVGLSWDVMGWSGVRCRVGWTRCLSRGRVTQESQARTVARITISVEGKKDDGIYH